MSENKPSFAGSVPELYHRLLVPLIFEDYALDLVDRTCAEQPRTVLETACGTGVVTRHLRQRLPEGTSLHATDLSPPMLDVARSQLKEQPGILFQSADALSLPFDDESVDTVVCQFGVMFFPDKKQGYREAARVLRPGGRFLFNVWDSLAHNPIVECVANTVRDLAPDNPPGFLNLPFGYYDTSLIQTELEQSGFSDIDLFVLKKTSSAPSARDAALALTGGTPLAAQLAERGLAQAALEAVEQALRKQFGAGAISAPMQAITFVARRS